MTCCFLLWEFPFRHRRLSQVDLTKSHKGLFVMILALTMQIKSVTLKGNHFRPFITYIILYPDTSSKEECFDDDGICGFIGYGPRRVGLLRFSHLPETPQGEPFQTP